MSLLWLACSSAGCAQLFDYVDSACYECKCDHNAKRAWMECRDLYDSVAYPYNFGEGFRAGYKAVCMGRDGCSPPTPPRRYWSSCYLNCEGKGRAMAWYDGYGHGVVAASCGGCASNCQIAVAGGTGDSGELGSALKGYEPPMRNPYSDPLQPDAYGPEGPGLQPTPRNQPLIPRPDYVPDVEPMPLDEFIPGEGEELVPEAPAAQRQDPPYLPAAEAYRVPVF